MTKHIQRSLQVVRDRPKYKDTDKTLSSDIEAYLKAGGKITMLEYAGDEKSRHEAMQSISLV